MTWTGIGEKVSTILSVVIANANEYNRKEQFELRQPRDEKCVPPFYHELSLSLSIVRTFASFEAKKIIK